MQPEDRADDISPAIPRHRPTMRALRRALERDTTAASSPGVRRLREIGLSADEILSVLQFLAETQAR
jgi:hypothetical protein